MAKKKAVKTSKDSGESKLWAFLAYLLGIVGFILVIALKRNDKFAMFHAKQSLVLFIFMVLVSFVGGIIPFIGWFIIWPFGSLLATILFIQGVVYSLTGKQKPLWLIGKFGEKMKF